MVLSENCSFLKIEKKNVMFAFEFSIVKCMLFSDCKR